MVHTSNCLSHLLLWGTIHVCFFYNKDDILGPALLPVLKMPSPVFVQDKHAFIVHTHWHHKYEEWYIFYFTSLLGDTISGSVINIFKSIFTANDPTYSKMPCHWWYVCSIKVTGDSLERWSTKNQSRFSLEPALWPLDHISIHLGEAEREQGQHSSPSSAAISVFT